MIVNDISMENIGKLFDGISNQYDRFNHVTSMGIDRCWRRQAVRSLPLCQRVLDVASGTADFAIEAVKRGKAQEVVGIDLSEGMMQVGRRKLTKMGLQERVTLMQADCAKLPFEDNTFDAITCGYGVRNFAMLDESLAEMHRVLKPGGELRILEFTYPTNPVVRALYDFYFTHVMPMLGRLIAHDTGAFVYFMNSVKQFCKGQAFVEHLEKAGFVDTGYRPQTFGISTLYSGRKS